MGYVPLCCVGALVAESGFSRLVGAACTGLVMVVLSLVFTHSPSNAQAVAHVADLPTGWSNAGTAAGNGDPRLRNLCSATGTLSNTKELIGIPMLLAVMSNMIGISSTGVYL